MAISLLFIIFAPVINAVEITFNSPQEVKINQEFSVSIEVNSSKIFDVKIFVHNSTDERVGREDYISEIFNDNNEWQDSWNYIKSAYPNKKEYKIRVVESPGGREICVRVRESETASTYVKCSRISVQASENNNDNEENEEQNNFSGNDQNQDESENETEEGSQDNEEESNNQEEVSNLENNRNNENNLTLEEFSSIAKNGEEKDGKIILNAKKLNNDKDEKDFITTKYENIRVGIVYTFFLFLIVLIILLALRRL